MGSRVAWLIRSARRFRRQNFYPVRQMATDQDCGGTEIDKKGVVLGAYINECGIKLTPAAECINSRSGGKLLDNLEPSMPLEKGRGYLLQGIDKEYPTVVLVGLGPDDAAYNHLEGIDEFRENIRVAASVGVRKMRSLEIPLIVVDGMGCAESAAEGASLTAWRFQENRNPDNKFVVPVLEKWPEDNKESWDRGVFKAECQNMARYLSDMPSNQMTPPMFCEKAMDFVCPCGVFVRIRESDWIQMQKMGAFLHVAKGSAEPPLFIEMSYCGGPPDEKPIVLSGKGITYDSGGLYLKKCPWMKEFKADLSGAAAVIAVMRAVGTLKLPINVNACIPVCENMLSGMSMKPGDIVMANNGYTIRICRPDCEGRLVMADVLTYCVVKYKPQVLVDVGTYTASMKAAMGGAGTGVFTNSCDMWHEMRKAGAVTGDRVWRFPLWDHFRRRVLTLTEADIANHGSGRGGGACKAAAFLSEFVPCGDWVHLDTGSCGMKAETPDCPYLEVGRMTGRPTRTLIQFLCQLACDLEECVDDPPPPPDHYHSP